MHFCANEISVLLTVVSTLTSTMAFGRAKSLVTRACECLRCAVTCAIRHGSSHRN
jgi:hypothetical protein